MVPPGTLARCHWCPEPWLQTPILALRVYWCWCQQLEHAGCSKASPPCRGSLRHGCPRLFGQLWKWSQPHPQKGCTSPHCPPYQGQCAAERQKRSRNGRLRANFSTDKNSEKAPVWAFTEYYDTEREGKLTMHQRENLSLWKDLQNPFLSDEKNNVILLSKCCTD